MESDRHRAVIQIVDTNLQGSGPSGVARSTTISRSGPNLGVRFIPIGLAIVASCIKFGDSAFPRIVKCSSSSGPLQNLSRIALNVHRRQLQTNLFR